MDISHKVSVIVQNVLVIFQSAVSAFLNRATVQNITQRLDQIQHKQSLNFRLYLGIGLVIMFKSHICISHYPMFPHYCTVTILSIHHRWNIRTNVPPIDMDFVWQNSEEDLC